MTLNLKSLVLNADPDHAKPDPAYGFSNGRRFVQPTELYRNWDAGVGKWAIGSSNPDADFQVWKDRGM